MSTRSQSSVATDADVEDGVPADVVSEKQLSMSQLRQMIGSSLLKCWTGVGERAMAMLARYQRWRMMLTMMFAAADNDVTTKIVAATAAAAVISAASADVVVVIPEVVVVVVGKHPAMDSSATMSNRRGFLGLRSSCLR